MSIHLGTIFWGHIMNNSKNIGFGLLALVALIILPGCAKQSKIIIKKIQAVPAQDADYQQTQDNITLRAKMLEREECAQLTGRKKTKAFHKRTKVIQFTTVNNSTTPLLLKPKKLSEP